MTGIVEGPKIAALSCGKAVYLVVLLHGPDSRGEAIINHALNWAPTMPKAEFLAVEAPFVSPSGGRRWSDASGSRDLDVSASLLDKFLDDMLAQRRLPESHLALVGFSDGARLALQVGLRRPKPIAAIVSFSGAIEEDDALFQEIRVRPPVLMIHGEADATAPFAAMTATKERLKALGVPVKSLRRPGLGHEMDDDGVIAAGDFLSAQLVHKSSAHTEDEHSDEHEHG
ncbi:alpha/beta hydrolase [Methylocystis bryophila]|uniref:Phospholipase n=1 Tax=Methylocystis bryophila TaxID=655015 RepID=A0A1W6N111_9HYPH|nr:dienelactone hydrolase family protein [Methylocystis bryophila]ARN83486.1 phospholipase [Methylocystis bryophila]BDV36906.1 phospholipase [Methylocystis bryophila]